MRPSRRAGLPLAALTGAALAAALLLLAGPSLAQLPTDAQDAPGVTGAPWTAWLATTPDDGSVSEYIDIEFTSDDQPVILYHADHPDANVPHLKERTPLGWTTDHVPDTLTVDGSLALDAQDRPHVAYDWSNADGTERKLIYGHRTASGSWILTEVHDVSPDGVNIELNDTGHPRISYEADDSALYFAYQTSSGWVREEVDSKGGFDTDLALDGNGDPHIAYTAGSDIWYASKTGGSWVTELAQEDCGSLRVSLALDSQDRPHIACHLTSSGLGHVWKDAGGWHHEVVDKGDGLVINHPGGKVGMSPSIALDETDTPHIGYRYIPVFGNPLLAPGQPHYATQVDGEWVVEVVDRDGQHNGLGMDLALDGEDRPHLTYVRNVRFLPGGGFPGSGPLQSYFDLRYARPLPAETLGQAGR